MHDTKGTFVHLKAYLHKSKSYDTAVKRNKMLMYISLSSVMNCFDGLVERGLLQVQQIKHQSPLSSHTSNRKLGTLVATLFVCWLLNVPATWECISGTDLFRQLHVLPHWIRSCRSNFPSHPVTVYWHRANQSQHWLYNARRMAG